MLPFWSKQFLVEGTGAELTAQRAVFKDDSSKADAFDGCIYWKIFAYVNHIIDTIFPCRDATIRR
jgi:hypothetical protein